MTESKETTVQIDDARDEDLRLSIKPLTERRMKLLKDFRIESDEDCRELGEMFSEDD